MVKKLGWALLVVFWTDLYLWTDATRTVSRALPLLPLGAAAVWLAGRRALPVHQHGPLRFATASLAVVLLALSIADVPDRLLRRRLLLWAHGARTATVAEATADPPFWVELRDGRLGADCDPPCAVPITGADGRGGIWLCDALDEPRPLRGTLTRPDGLYAAAVARAAAAAGVEDPLCLRWSYVDRAAFEARAAGDADKPLVLVHLVLLLGLYFVSSAPQRSGGSGS
jgi:hypothetical protein